MNNLVLLCQALLFWWRAMCRWAIPTRGCFKQKFSLHIKATVKILQRYGEGVHKALLLLYLLPKGTATFSCGCWLLCTARHRWGYVGVMSSSIGKTAPHFGCFMIYSPTARGNDLKKAQSVAAWMTGGNLALGEV